MRLLPTLVYARGVSAGCCMPAGCPRGVVCPRGDVYVPVSFRLVSNREDGRHLLLKRNVWVGSVCVAVYVCPF